jgi:hypothetical protein
MLCRRNHSGLAGSVMQWGDGRQRHCALTTDDEMSVLIEY